MHLFIGGEHELLIKELLGMLKATELYVEITIDI